MCFSSASVLMMFSLSRRRHWFWGQRGGPCVTVCPPAHCAKFFLCILRMVTLFHSHFCCMLIDTFTYCIIWPRQQAFSEPRSLYRIIFILFYLHTRHFLFFSHVSQLMRALFWLLALSDMCCFAYSGRLLKVHCIFWSVRFWNPVNTIWFPVFLFCFFGWVGIGYSHLVNLYHRGHSPLFVCFNVEHPLYIVDRFHRQTIFSWMCWKRWMFMTISHIKQ